MPPLALYGAATVVVSLALGAASGGEPPPERPSGRLVVGLHPPERMAVVDVESGEMEERRLPGGALCHGPLLVSGGRIVFSGSHGNAPAALSIDPELDGPARSLGRAQQYFPSRDGRLWLVGLRGRRAPLAPASIREITAAGRTTFVSRHRAPRHYLMGALAHGLVFEHRGKLNIWDPRRGTTRRLRGGSFAVAMGGRRAAWCGGRCRKLRLTGPHGRATAQAPPGVAFHSTGAFSPDGSLLALPAVEGGSDGTRIALVDTRSGSVRLVPDARTDSYGAVTWSRAGWLYFAARSGRLMAYRPGERRTVALPVRLPDPALGVAAID